MSRVPTPMCRTIVAGLLLCGTGCRAATLAYGPDVASARVNAEAFASALEQRFTRVVRQPKFLYARMRMGRFALSPSKLVNDTALWTSARSTLVGAERDLEVAGTVIGGRYTFSPRTPVASPVRTGDSRHVIGLIQLSGENEWQWTTQVENAIGSMPPARAADIMRALFLSAERPASEIRADYREAFPRTTAALGRLLTIDSLSTVAQQDGSTLVAMHIHISGDSLRAEFPELSRYVRKYLAPARFRFRLSDKAGADWFDVQNAKSRLIMRFRTRGGDLQPLGGPSRHMPDTLVLHVDASARISFFTVGASNVEGEFVHVNTGTQREWAMRFTREPHWDLPLLTEQLLNTPLKRPFEGAGVQFRIGFIRGGDGQTLLARKMVLAVRESAIMRFLGNLGFTAMSDFAGQVEEEENRFLAELFAAMRADVAAIR